MVKPDQNQTSLGPTRRKLLAALSMGGVLTGAWLYEGDWSETVSSPDGTVRVRLRSDGQFPTYSLTVDGTTVIRDSALGFTLKDRDVLSEELRIGSVSRDSVRDRWRPAWGEKRIVHDEHEELSATVTNSDGDPVFTVVFRVFDDGIGFRYVIPDEGVERGVITDELTSFEFTSDHSVWYPTSSGMDIRGPTTLRDLQDISTPVTAKSRSRDQPGYLCIHEAGLFDAAGMSLSSGAPRTLESELSSNVPFEAPYRTPWRVVLIGDPPGELIESDVILNLAPESRVEDTSWIRTGRSMWDWRLRGTTADGFTYRLDTASIQRLVDFATERGLRYTLVDAGWYGDERDPGSDPTVPRPGLEIRDVIDDARSKDVGILLYVNDLALHEYDVERVLETYADWGAAGIKHGFLDGDTYSDVRFVERLLEETAERELLYNVHEAYKPTGERRTYPHFLTREFVQSTADGRPQGYASPEYRVTLPFVNMIGGPLDVTPGLFSLDSKGSREHIRGPVESTIVAQVAQCVVVRTGLLHLPDHPEAYESRSDLFEFVQALPPMDWDETHVSDGEIGSHISLARRSGESWFIGCLTDSTSRSVSVPLTFLASDTTYEATIYADGEEAHYKSNPEAYDVHTAVAVESDSIDERLAPGGGLVAHLTPK